MIGGTLQEGTREKDIWILIGQSTGDKTTASQWKSLWLPLSKTLGQLPRDSGSHRIRSSLTLMSI
eukprot:12470014-Prorocentrum_lima.AAC.1